MFKGPGPGRPKGSINKSTKMINDFRDQHGDQWIMEVWAIATSATSKESDRLKALDMLGKKVFPDMKSIELSGELDTQPEKQIDLTTLESTELEVLKKVLEQKAKDND
jgi:hypothetical protein